MHWLWLARPHLSLPPPSTTLHLGLWRAFASKKRVSAAGVTSSQDATTTSNPANGDEGMSATIAQSGNLPQPAEKEKDEINPCGIQVLDAHVRSQLFPQANSTPMTKKVFEEMKSHLTSVNLWGRSAPLLPKLPVFKVPGLEGSDIEEHFLKIGSKLSEPYLTLAKGFVETFSQGGRGLPPLPAVWKMVPGWMRYSNGVSEPVKCPTEALIFFDVETCVKDGEYPTLATAMSTDAWYLWCSHRLCAAQQLAGSNTPSPDAQASPVACAMLPPHELIPLENDAPTSKLVIGHFVGYDRQRVREQYRLRESPTAFLDTASLHMATSGFSSQQRRPWYTENARRQKEGAEGQSDAPASRKACVLSVSLSRSL